MESILDADALGTDMDQPIARRLTAGSEKVAWGPVHDSPVRGRDCGNRLKRFVRKFSNSQRCAQPPGRAGTVAERILTQRPSDRRPVCGSLSQYPKPDQSGLVLAFGILSWFVCPIFGVVAWVMGRTALQDIAAGLADPANKGLLQFGYYLGMVNVILYTICFGGYIVVAALAITLG